MTYRLSPQALRDLEEIGDFIAKDNPAAAVAFVRRLEDRWHLLAAYPHSGAARDDILPGTRHLVVGSYLSLYRVEEGQVLILRVLHGHRAIGAEDII